MKKWIFVKKTFFCTEFYSAYENYAYFDYSGAPGPQKDDDDDDDDFFFPLFFTFLIFSWFL